MTDSGDIPAPRHPPKVLPTVLVGPVAASLTPGLAVTIGVSETNTSAVSFADAVARRELLTVFDPANRDALLAELAAHGIEVTRGGVPRWEALGDGGIRAVCEPDGYCAVEHQCGQLDVGMVRDET